MLATARMIVTPPADQPMFDWLNVHPNPAIPVGLTTLTRCREPPGLKLSSPVSNIFRLYLQPLQQLHQNQARNRPAPLLP